ncbi:MAG: hypothetical protein HYV07_11150 [Deltaproteobacteria bacterium]|nr:hypothetical protein [Deltaproteobacteria bacterium]
MVPCSGQEVRSTAAVGPSGQEHRGGRPIWVREAGREAKRLGDLEESILEGLVGSVRADGKVVDGQDLDGQAGRIRELAGRVAHAVDELVEAVEIGVRHVLYDRSIGGHGGGAMSWCLHEDHLERLAGAVGVDVIREESGARDPKHLILEDRSPIGRRTGRIGFGEDRDGHGGGHGFEAGAAACDVCKCGYAKEIGVWVEGERAKLGAEGQGSRPRGLEEHKRQGLTARCAVVEANSRRGDDEPGVFGDLVVIVAGDDVLLG